MNNLKKIRNEKKVSIKELSEKTNISIYTLQSVESNRRHIEQMCLSNVLKICNVLKCEISDLLT